MVGPILQNLLESVRELKELRRAYERLVEKYDGYLAKPDRNKEPTVREETYLLETLDYLARLRQFRVTFELGLLDKMSIGLGGFGEFCWALGTLFRALEGDENRLREELPRWQAAEETRLAGLKRAPRRPNGLTQLELVKSGKKSGYLYKRVGRALSSKGNWKRVYCELDGAHFTLTAQGRHRSRIQHLARVSVLLCEARTVEVADRRGCFEIYTSQEAWVLCCQEGEDEMREWLRAFEGAKTTAIRASTLGTVVEEPEQDAGRAASPPRAMEYLLMRQNDELHRMLPAMEEAEAVLGHLCGILRLACDSYLVGRLFVTAQALYLQPATLFSRTESRVVVMPFAGIQAVEPQPLGEHLMAQCLIKLREDDEHEPPSALRGSTNISMMCIEQTSIDLLARLHRNSTLPKPKTTQELLTELNLRTATPSPRQRNYEDDSDDEQELQQTQEPTIDEEVPCGCAKHLEVTETNVIFPVPADTLFNMMFGAGCSRPLKTLFTKLGYTGAECGDWQEQSIAPSSTTTDDAATMSRLERDVRYIVPVNNPLLKAKGTPCHERNMQIIVEPGRRYIVDTEARTPQVPYGDTFITLSRCCITSVGAEKSRLRMSGGMHWIRSPLVKSIIRDATMKGFSRYCKGLVEALREEIKMLKPELDTAAIIQETPPSPQPERSPSTSGSSMLHGLAAELARTGKRLAFRYAFIFSFVVLLFAMWLSAFLFKRTYQALFLRPQYILLSPDQQPAADLLQAIPDLEHWRDQTYAEAYRDLCRRDQTLQDVGHDLLRLARELHRLRGNIGQAQYATWLAEQLTACYLDTESTAECARLEDQWQGLVRI